MNTLQQALIQAGIVADLSRLEEEMMEDDTELTPIQRRLILRKLERREQQMNSRREK